MKYIILEDKDIPNSKRCLSCNNELRDLDRKFCSRKCLWKEHHRKDYQLNKEKILVRSRIWKMKNLEKFNKIVRRSLKKAYDKDKTKFISRAITHQVMKRENLIDHCHVCGSKENLEIHHEEYSGKTTEIQRLIQSGKIYVLCRTCHVTITNMARKATFI